MNRTTYNTTSTALLTIQKGPELGCVTIDKGQKPRHFWKIKKIPLDATLKPVENLDIR